MDSNELVHSENEKKKMRIIKCPAVSKLTATKKCSHKLCN